MDKLTIEEAIADKERPFLSRRHIDAIYDAYIDTMRENERMSNLILRLCELETGEMTTEKAREKYSILGKLARIVDYSYKHSDAASALKTMGEAFIKQTPSDSGIIKAMEKSTQHTNNEGTAVETGSSDESGVTQRPLPSTQQSETLLHWDGKDTIVTDKAIYHATQHRDYHTCMGPLEDDGTFICSTCKKRCGQPPQNTLTQGFCMTCSEGLEWGTGNACRNGCTRDHHNNPPKHGQSPKTPE